MDDNSPDGTGRIADSLASELEPVEVLHRGQKEGLGRRLPRGLPARARRAGADLVLEMDSDFSHSPADVPRLIEAAKEADLVLGSRYVPGGGVERLGAHPAAVQPRRLVVRTARACGSGCAT